MIHFNDTEKSHSMGKTLEGIFERRPWLSCSEIHDHFCGCSHSDRAWQGSQGRIFPQWKDWLLDTLRALLIPPKIVKESKMPPLSLLGWSQTYPGSDGSPSLSSSCPQSLTQVLPTITSLDINHCFSEDLD